MTAEWGRVLAPWGSIAIELGDSYSGSTASGGDYHLREVEGRATRRESFITNGVQPNTTVRKGTGWPGAKSLALIPQLYAIALAYGINPLTGAASPAGRWLVRNVIVWHRPNPAVGALGDKFRPSTSYITVATRARDRWFDLDAVRGEPSPNTHSRIPKGAAGRTDLPSQQRDGNWSTLPAINEANPAGAPPLDTWFDEHDTWTITTQPSRLAHYAMWPPKLAERLILSMCPEWVCGQCGAPRRRINRSRMLFDRAGLAAHIEQRREAAGFSRRDLADRFPHYKNTDSISAQFSNWERGKNVPSTEDWQILKASIEVSADYDALIDADAGLTHEYTPTTAHGLGLIDNVRNKQPMVKPGLHHATVHVPDLGWSDCGCSASPFCVHGREHAACIYGCEPQRWRPGVVLDPFCGTFTTGAVAHLHGRDAIGIDLDARNADLYPARLAECKRALFGTLPEMAGQMDMFEESA